jgi:drug/metabolite transporter (DMT)-like permease
MDYAASRESEREMPVTAELAGTIMVLLSATGFGALPILAKYGYATGLVLDQMLALRFLIASVGMSVLVAVSGHSPLRIGARKALSLLALGVIGYGGQSFAFFAALRSLPASLTELVLYTYPAIVAIGGWLLFKRAVPGRHWLAMLASFLGLTLLVGNIRLELTTDLAFAIAAPLAYGLYIVAGEYLMRGTPAILASTIVIYGAALAWSAVSIAGGHLVLPSCPQAWTVVGLLAVVPSMASISLFLAALPRIGGGRTALLSMWEPIFAVILAFMLLGEQLGALQVAGGLTVLVAVFSLQWSGWRRQPSSES